MNPAADRPASHPANVYTLHPGDVVCGERGDRLETLLGSCVAVILSDRSRTIGAMCHIVHSRPAVRNMTKPTASADAALTAMYAMLTDYGLNPRLCEAFVYGGGNMFPRLFTQSHVGESNGRQVLERLADDGICVVHQDIGGRTYRRLRWTIGHEMPAVEAVDIGADS